MGITNLFEKIMEKKSFLCVGLDSDITRIPEHLKKLDDPVFEFNKQIIEATQQYTVAYKPNIAFYESRGSAGWESLRKTTQYLHENYSEIFVIADAKRGDIGNTSEQYAKTFFDPEAAGLYFDAVTVVPYMGRDSVVPFLKYKDKWVILLALTSNSGSDDFQFFYDNTYQRLYEKVIKTAQYWGTKDNLMYVVGATKAQKLKDIRRIALNNFLLVPGIGAQGGSLDKVAKYGMNSKCGLLVNSSRGIIFADSTEKFAQKAGEAAQKIQKKMSQRLDDYFNPKPKDE